MDENQYKSDFLSMVSHELRTPLTSIVAFADLLSKHRAGADENEAKALAGIEANSQALMLMINDILEMSRLDAGRVKLSLEVVDIGDVVGIVRATVGPLAAKEHLEFTSEVAPDVPLVRGDFDKLVHVLQNLCGNAVKFTPDGGAVHLKAAFHPASSKGIPDEVWLTVADSGIGIDAADQERIFEKFVQVVPHPPGATTVRDWDSPSCASTPRCTGLCERGKRAGPGSFLCRAHPCVWPGFARSGREGREI
ncbi:MAG: sensor histidine kinase [Collinsella sp.]